MRYTLHRLTATTFAVMDGAEQVYTGTMQECMAERTRLANAAAVVNLSSTKQQKRDERKQGGQRV